MIPKNVASSGTGAGLALDSGPCTATLTCPRCCQKTRSQCAAAIDVIWLTSELLLRHTRSIYGDSDGRLSISKPTRVSTSPHGAGRGQISSQGQLSSAALMTAVKASSWEITWSSTRPTGAQPRELHRIIPP